MTRGPRARMAALRNRDRFAVSGQHVNSPPSTEGDGEFGSAGCTRARSRYGCRTSCGAGVPEAGGAASFFFFFFFFFFLAGLRLLGPARLGRAQLGLPGLHGFSIVTGIDVPVRRCLSHSGPLTWARHAGVVVARHWGSFGAVSVGCVGAGKLPGLWPRRPAARSRAADGDAGTGQKYRGCLLYASPSCPLTLSHRPRHGRKPVLRHAKNT